MTELYQQILQIQSTIPRQFSKTISTDFGEWYINRNNTLSVDANHGVVNCPLRNYALAFEETEEFYRKNRMTPRLWLYLPEDEIPKAAAAAEQFGGIFAVSDLQLLIKQPSLQSMRKTKLQFTEEHTFDPLLRETVIEEDLQLEGILSASLKHEGVRHILGRLFETPVTMALFYEAPQLVRLSNIKTGSEFRGCGFGGALLPYALNRAAELGKPAYLFANNPVAIRLYERSGMKVCTPDFVLCQWEKK